MSIAAPAETLKAVLLPWRRAMADFKDAAHIRHALTNLCAPDVTLHMCHPFGDLNGADKIYDMIYQPLITALPDLERRDLILLAGTTPEGLSLIHI